MFNLPLWQEFQKYLNYLLFSSLFNIQYNNSEVNFKIFNLCEIFESLVDEVGEEKEMTNWSLIL